MAKLTLKELKENLKTYKEDLEWSKKEEMILGKRMAQSKIICGIMDFLIYKSEEDLNADILGEIRQLLEIVI